MVKVPTSTAADLGFDSCLHHEDFSRSCRTSDKNWYFSGYPDRHIALQGQCWDWLALCQHTGTGWGSVSAHKIEQIRLWDTLACFARMTSKQASKQQTNFGHVASCVSFCSWHSPVFNIKISILHRMECACTQNRSGLYCHPKDLRQTPL